MTISTAEEAENSSQDSRKRVCMKRWSISIAATGVTRASELLKLRTIRSRSMAWSRSARWAQANMLAPTDAPADHRPDRPALRRGVRAGQPVREDSCRHDGEVFPEIGGRYIAHVTAVDSVFDAASATIGVRLELPNPGNDIPAGLTCQVRFAGVG